MATHHPTAPARAGERTRLPKTQVGPVTVAIRTMRKAARIDDMTQAVAALRAMAPETDGIPQLRDLRKALADRIEADIALLDALEGDADFEQGAGDMPEIDAGDEPEGVSYGLHDATEDDEPSLGSLGSTTFIADASQEDWASGGSEDREDGDDNGLGDADGMQEQRLRDELEAA